MISLCTFVYMTVYRYDLKLIMLKGITNLFDKPETYQTEQKFPNPLNLLSSQKALFILWVFSKSFITLQLAMYEFHVDWRT